MALHSSFAPLKDTRGSAFTPSYSATLEPADATLKGIVMKCAGPR